MDNVITLRDVNGSSIYAAQFIINMIEQKYADDKSEKIDLILTSFRAGDIYLQKLIKYIEEEKAFLATDIKPLIATVRDASDIYYNFHTQENWKGNNVAPDFVHAAESIELILMDVATQLEKYYVELPDSNADSNISSAEPFKEAAFLVDAYLSISDESNLDTGEKVKLRDQVKERMLQNREQRTHH